jgi:hypothetical protein
MDFETMTVNQLREQFAQKFGRPATSRNKTYLVRKMSGLARESKAKKDLLETPAQLAKRLTKAGTSVREVCKALRAAGHKTVRGGSKWWPSSVQGLLK